MRRSVIILPCALAALLCASVAGAQDARSGVDREARVRFNASLPPHCERGWNGRGNGVVAICRLANRSQARFIDGRVTVCARPDCADRAAEIDAFLKAQGF